MTGPADGGAESLYAALRTARRDLSSAGVASAEADAAELAGFVLGVGADEVDRRAILREAWAPGERERFDALVEERCRRVPLQHLTGRAHFRRLTLAVGPGVFVPRPETEVAAGLAIDAVQACLAAGVDEPVVVDLCTGSGAIALAVADEAPKARVYAIELSREAHAWAVRNVELTGLPVEVRLGDAVTSFEDLVGAVDVVVSNPPYIPAGAAPVDPEVRDHDPEVALFGGGEDGLALPRLVAARASALLRPGGVIVMEHADSQGETLPAALRRTGSWAHVEDHEDLTGRPRVTVAVRSQT